MTPTERGNGTRVELYGRETLPPPAAERKERVAERLETLERQGQVDAVRTSSWPKRIACDGTAEEDARDRYLLFEAWAAERGVRLTPFFQTRECYSMETGERGNWIVFPALCLAIYEDGDLAAVYPHADGDTYRSVLAGVSAIAERSEESTEDPERTVVGTAD